MNSLSVENQAWLPSHGRLCLALQFSRVLLAAKYPFLCGCFFGLRRSSFLPFWTGPPGKGMNKCWTRPGRGKSGRHSSDGRFVMLAGPVWKWLHLTIWTPSWELKQRQTQTQTASWCFDCNSTRTVRFQCHDSIPNTFSLRNLSIWASSCPVSDARAGGWCRIPWGLRQFRSLTTENSRGMLDGEFRIPVPFVEFKVGTRHWHFYFIRFVVRFFYVVKSVVSTCHIFGHWMALTRDVVQEMICEDLDRLRMWLCDWKAFCL